MKRLALLLCLLATPIWAVEYPLVAVRIPWDGVSVHRWPSATDPLATHQGSDGAGLSGVPQVGGDLTLIAPDGNVEVLVDSGPEGNVIDPQLTDDAAWVYYAKRLTLAGKFDVYRLNLATRAEEKITSGGNNIAPCLLGNQLVFNSDRDGFRNNGNFVGNRPQNCFLTFAADLDGKNIERIGAWHLGSSLHNEVYRPNGKLMFATGETMGGRGALVWGIWAYNRDGTSFEPFWSAYASSTLHPAFSLPDGRMGVVFYYSPRNGTGTIYTVTPYPTGSPAPPSRFVSTSKTGLSNVSTDEFKQEFMTTGGVGLTLFTHPADSFAKVIDGIKQGFVAHPAPTPDGLLMTWTGTDEPIQPANWQAWQTRGRIVLLPGYTPISNSNQLQIVKDDPAFSYFMPRAVLSRTVPPMPAWHKNDGTIYPTILPKGTPFALIGSASTLGREWLPWAAPPDGGQIPATVTDDDQQYLRIYSLRPSPQNDPSPFEALQAERMEILADIPIRHVRPDGTVPLDSKGNPDTSWLAKVPGDTSVTFAVLNANKEQIALARTWHGFRPGEARHDCGGCHQHVASATDWNSTEAFRFLNGTAQTNFSIADATHPRIIQLERDVQPTLTALNLTPVVYRGSHFDLPAGFNTLPARSLRSTLYTGLTATPEQKALVRDWIDSGAGQGPGILVDDLHPVLTVQEPGREQTTPITAIRFGAYDLHSGVQSVSVKASFAVGGRAANAELADLFTAADHIWTLAIPEQAAGEVTVTATDAAGNAETMVRTFDAGAVPPPPDTCEALRAERDALLLKLNAAKAKTGEVELKVQELRALLEQ